MKYNIQALVELLKDKYNVYRFRAAIRKCNRKTKDVSMLCELCYMNGRIGGR